MAIFAVGLAVLGGLFLAPRDRPPSAPSDVPWGAPDDSLVFVTCDVARLEGGAGGAAAGIGAAAGEAGRAGGPDYVLLVRVTSDEALALARALKMEASFRPQHHQRVPRGEASATGGSDAAGVCILSKHPLYEGGPVRLDRKKAAGVWAVSVAGGRKFAVACAWRTPAVAGDAPAALASHRAAAGDPPAVLALGQDGGAAGAPPAGFARLTVPEVLPADGDAVSLLATREWEVVSARAAAPIAWYVLKRGGPGTVTSSAPTHPATRPR